MLATLVPRMAFIRGPGTFTSPGQINAQLPFDLVPKAHVIGDTRGLVKLVANRETKQVLGVHILSPHAADLIHEGVLAVKNKLTIDDIIDTVHVFPTLSESIKLAAQSFYMDVGKMSCCVE